MFNNLAYTTGYDQGVFGGIIITPSFLELMGNPGPNLQGTIVSLYDIGWYVFPYTLSCGYDSLRANYIS